MLIKIDFQAILIMCDNQIFTGITVLISAFILLSRGIQAYHWQLIVYVAWFSSVTHISAMTVLRSFLRERRLETSVRFGLMTCLLIMLIIAFIPTLFFDWPSPSMEHCTAAEIYSPVICFFDVANGRQLSTSLDPGCGDMTPPSSYPGHGIVVSSTHFWFCLPIHQIV